MSTSLRTGWRKEILNYGRRRRIEREIPIRYKGPNCRFYSNKNRSKLSPTPSNLHPQLQLAYAKKSKRFPFNFLNADYTNGVPPPEVFTDIRTSYIVPQRTAPYGWETSHGSVLSYSIAPLLSDEWLLMSSGSKRPDYNRVQEILTLFDDLPGLQENIIRDELVQPGLRAVRTFLDALSSPGDVENVKEYVTPRLFQYLKLELGMTGKCRPVYQFMKKEGLRMIGALNSYALVGNPRIFGYVESYTYDRQLSTLDGSDSSIIRHRPAFDPPEPFKYVEVFKSVKSEHTALASGWPFSVADIRLTPWRVGFRSISKVQPWYEEQMASGKIKGMALRDIGEAFVKHMFSIIQLPGQEGSLAYIFDFYFDTPVKTRLVERDGAKERTIIEGKEEEKTIYVSLRSNHVTPGWKFNKETVRWYIDDINFTLRTMPWAKTDDKLKRGGSRQSDSIA